MGDRPQGHRWDPVLLVVGLLFLSSLACNGLGDRVQPDNPDLQPPISNIGMELSQFLQWIGTVPSDTLPPPWIVQPPSNIRVQTATVDVRGFAIRAGDRPELVPQSDSPVVTLYSVTGPGYPPTIKAKLAEAVVDESRSWAVSGVELDATVETYLAARVSHGRSVSNWSNVVQLYRMENASGVTIDSPADGAEFPEGTLQIAVTGTGPPDSSVTVYRRAHPASVPGSAPRKLATATVDADGRWEAAEVRLLGGDSYLFAKPTNSEEDALQSNEIRVHKPALTWPVDLQYKAISQWFGECNTYRHLGIDIAVNGATVFATAGGKARLFRHCVDKEGKVRCVNEDEDCNADACSGCGCGHFVCIDHDSGAWKGYRSCYGHLSEFSVTEGQSVTPGQKIGLSDNTGGSTGPHLHFELWRHGQSGNWEVVNINPGHQIKNTLPGTGDDGTEKAWWWGEGDDLIALDWEMCTAGTYANDTLVKWTGDKSCQAGAGCEWVCLSTFDFGDMGCGEADASGAVVKGRVLKKDGKAIEGAALEIWLDGARWSSPSNPVKTDKDGWYEFEVTPGQRVRFESLVIGESTKTISPEQPEVQTMQGCARTVNFR
ncbi:MAG TPA: peptidoglycan DD-metalloendopeptidase family protein, partial [Anaerolineae bacterium]|nr:peptidoglycan DD-metalloendopeptidase family protein [Anaerolineae bacterium]